MPPVHSAEDVACLIPPQKRTQRITNLISDKIEVDDTISISGRWDRKIENDMWGSLR